ncbi:MAG: hypothetical protein N4A46_02790 [Schleiferiaceae bacterium]|nr:hypothetical protein [Schleiferiaceae bacterium]
MKGKKLEILVLVVAFLILAAAMYMMYVGTVENNIEAMSLVNRLFSVGFLVYIAYSYILSNNLNKEIVELEKNIDNLKNEVARKRKKLKAAEKEVTEKTAEIEKLTADNAGLSKDLANAKKQVTKLKGDLKKLQEAAEKESSSEE